MGCIWARSCWPLLHHLPVCHHLYYHRVGTWAHHLQLRPNHATSDVYRILLYAHLHHVEWALHTYRKYARLGTMDCSIQSIEALYGGHAFGIPQRKRTRRFNQRNVGSARFCGFLQQLGYFQLSKSG